MSIAKNPTDRYILVCVNSVFKVVGKDHNKTEEYELKTNKVNLGSSVFTANSLERANRQQDYKSLHAVKFDSLLGWALVTGSVSSTINLLEVTQI